MYNDIIHTIDLNFQGTPHAIAAYLVPHDAGGVLVECGPGSTIQFLERGLETNGLRVEDITDLLVTHIHLDHAGAAGWLAQHGVRVHVHHRGSAHMQNPGKLLASAKRIYGDQMDALWGEFLPVPEEQLNILHDGDEIIIHGLHFKAIDTPGHANHHMAYVLGKTCFAGDVGGVRLPGPFHLQLPMPPPDLDLKKWRTSVERLKAADIQRIALTHFGIYDGMVQHWDALQNALTDVEQWIENTMQDNLSSAILREKLREWDVERLKAQGLDAQLKTTYELANPTWMSAVGLERYWRKFRK